MRGCFVAICLGKKSQRSELPTPDRQKRFSIRMRMPEWELKFSKDSTFTSIVTPYLMDRAPITHCHHHDLLMMMIAFITLKSSLTLIGRCICSSINLKSRSHCSNFLPFFFAKGKFVQRKQKGS